MDVSAPIRASPKQETGPVTTNKKPFSIPARLIVLDVVGTLFVVIGLLALTAGIELLPTSLRFDGYGVAFIIAGVILMLPLIAHVVARVAKGARSDI